MSLPGGNNEKNWITSVEAPNVAKQDYGEPERPYGIVRDESSKFK